MASTSASSARIGRHPGGGAAAARPTVCDRARRVPRRATASPARRSSLTRHPRTRSRLRAVPPSDDAPADPEDPASSSAAFGGALAGGLADALADDASEDDVVNALGMRANLLGDARETEAKRQAMANLAMLMSSGNAGALNSIAPDLLPLLLRLPSTAGNVDALTRCAEGISAWKASLSRGLLPGSEIAWPDDVVFREALVEALGDLDMARFTRQFPPVLDTLMKNILDVLYVYEQNRVDDGEDDSDQPSTDADGGGSDEDGASGDPEDDDDPAGAGGGGNGEESQDDQDSQGSGGSGGGSDDGGGDVGNQTAVDDIDFSMEGDDAGEDEKDAAREAAREAAKAANKEMVEKLMEDFKEQWEPAVDKLDKAAKAFEGLNLDDLAEGPEGFDVTKGLWQQTGWTELDSLRRKLEELRELRDLVRSLGRGSGRGPLRRAPRQRERRGAPVGLVRSALDPEETNGLCRSDDISRMLPSEMALIANGSRPARLLHFARRMERTLLSYERVGWSEEPAVTTEGTEIRPAAECGPIILCLDTSGSMMGARETVAKAMVLECMRQAKTQQRQCYLYSFSGPGDCQELELKVTGKGVSKLLEFLSGSFHGGTDVDEPFIRALDRLGEEEWQNADILLVTDGEIRPPTEEVVVGLDIAKEKLDLKVHALLVGEPGAGAGVVEELCTHTHTFKSWSKVGGRRP